MFPLPTWAPGSLLAPKAGPLPSKARSSRVSPRGVGGREGGKKRRGRWGGTLQDGRIRGDVPSFPHRKPAGVLGLVLHPLRLEALWGPSGHAEPKLCPSAPPGPFLVAWVLSLDPTCCLNHAPNSQGLSRFVFFFLLFAMAVLFCLLVVVSSIFLFFYFF